MNLKDKMFSTEEMAKNRETLDRLIENERSIENTLLRKGYTLQSYRPSLETKLLINLEATELVNTFYSLMANNIRRNILKRICLTKNDIELKGLCQRWSEGKLNKLRHMLLQCNIARQEGQNYFLVNQNSDFGPNFEWFVAELFKRELRCTSAWGIHIEEAPGGGDYDVLARSDSEIIYVECKAKPIQNISEEEVIYFFLRDEFLRPEIAIMLIDTRDNINEFEKLLNSIRKNLKEKIDEFNLTNFIRNVDKPLRLKEVNHNIKVLAERLFVCNTQEEVIKVIKACLKYHHRSSLMDQPIAGPFIFHKCILEVWKQEQ